MTDRILRGLSLCVLTFAATVWAQDGDKVTANPYMELMEKAGAHAKAHGALPPVLSPLDVTVLNGEVPLKELQAKGYRVVSWTTNDPEKMRQLIRMGVDGVISDRPDLLQQVLKEEREAAKGPEDEARLARFDVSAHRGGRGLRPENTLPSFESGLDQLSTTLETDTGVTTDGVSLIWHDQFLNPQSCRRADGAAYTMENRVYTRDISSTDAQKTFICDKLHFGPDQKNDLSLSPVAVAFAKKEGLISPYVPTYVEQLFRFVNFYVEYYRSGPGKGQPHATERAANAARVRFNLETKILPEHIPVPPEAKDHPEEFQNHTVGPQAFVDALCGAIVRNHMESRSEVQSFDFRTLILVEEQHPNIPTYYLTNSGKLLSSEFVPESLRATATAK
jgi:glycerophosphoryl diester phosphodiesterase